MSYIGSSAAPLPVAFAGVNGQSFNGGTNTFTLSRSVSKNTDIEVVVNNVQQNPYDGSYSVNGNILTTAETVSAGTSNVYVQYLDAPLGSLSDPLGTKKAGDTLTGALNEAATVTLASAGSVAIGAAASNTINISGTTTITSFDTIAAGAVRRLVFAGALTLTYNATSLILPGAANITTAAGDAAEFVSLGGGNWKCFNYTKANGQAVVAPAAGVTSITAGTGLTGGTITGTGTIALDVYSGSAANYASYAIGTYIVAQITGFPNIQTVKTLYSPPTAGGIFFLDTSQGSGSSVLAGTWRNRGLAADVGTGVGNNLFQRTA